MHFRHLRAVLVYEEVPEVAKVRDASPKVGLVSEEESGVLARGELELRASGEDEEETVGLVDDASSEEAV